MANNTTNQDINYKKRIKFTIPDFNKFGELLHDRLHTIVYHVEEIETKFTLITNLFDRTPERVAEAEAIGLEDTELLVYAGTQIQRKILEKDGLPNIVIGKKSKDIDGWRKERDQNWEDLAQSNLTRDNGSETMKYFDLAREGKLSLKDVKTESLAGYFANLDSDFKKYEYPIIKDYFDTNKTWFIGIPMMGMGLFQGIVWILFDKREVKRFDDPVVKRRLIKLFSMEYDQLVLSWDTFGINMNSKSLVEKSIQEVLALKGNPILGECKIKKYYEISDTYQKERIKQSDAVPEKLNAQYQKTATITTLLDSYAHNISAHSLTSLSWWFRERGDYTDTHEQKELIEELGRDNNPLIQHLKRYPHANLSNELHRLFKFLLEKGAFWSGITRQTNFAGKISSLFNLLWFDFANNPLYLGTIANTEDVRKIRLNITIYEAENRQESEVFRNTKIIKKNPKGILLDGTFALVNLDDFGYTTNRSPISIFVEKGELYDEFAEELDKMNVFFPGGVIGKHAFFTLLENEIRNVKHFSGATLRDIQQNGLTLNISIHERPVDSEKNTTPDKYALYKIGVWLKHPVNIDAALLVRRIEGLDGDIVNPKTFQPLMGGNYQDKICAAMLMTNTFDRVQEKNTSIGKIYYPWIKTAGYKIQSESPGQITEFEISQRKYQQEKENKTFETTFESEKGAGYLKKYFHLWKGDAITYVAPDQVVDTTENQSRFRFIHIEDNNPTQKKKYKSDGMIRVISGLHPGANLATAYSKWLPIWLQSDESNTANTVIDFVEGGTEVGRITYENEKIRFDSYRKLKDLTLEEIIAYQNIPNRIIITIEHGSKLTILPDKFNYRSHGELMSRFCKGIEKMSKVQDMDPEDAYELLEALSTQVCIFDRRIYSRLHVNDAGIDTAYAPAEEKKKLQDDRLQLYRDYLRLDFRTEDTNDWKAVKKEGFLRFHFVVVHLSFIESMKDNKGNSYKEENIIDFINDEILQGMPPEQVPDNFVLVITTGRGRMAWWDTIKAQPEYARFTTFRPIESLLGAVEDALQLPDDVNLKFNLVKLLFGS